MNKDLFGNEIPPIIDEVEQELKLYDSISFSERLKRLKYINQIFPFGTRIFGSDESNRIFDESIHSYICGHFVATITLSQAFIERRIQEYFHLRFDKKKATSTLNQLLKEFQKTGFIDDYFIERINKLRKKRNPFMHLKDPLHEDSLMYRSMNGLFNHDELLENDAKEAVSLMMIMMQFRVL